MSIADLWSRLQQAGYVNTAAGTVNLPANNTLGAADITSLLNNANVFPSGSIAMTGLAAPVVDGGSIVLSGLLSAPFIVFDNVAATLTFVELAGAPELLLQVTMARDWTFATTFSNLVDTSAGSATFTGAVLSAASTALTVNTAGYPAGVSFAGQIDLGASATFAMAALFPGGANMVTGGMTVTLDQGKALATFSLSSVPTSLSIAGIAIPGQAAVVIDASKTTGALGATLALPAGGALKTLTFSGMVNAPPAAGFTLSLDSPITLGNALGALSALFSGQSPAAAVPADVPLGQNISLKTASLTTAGASIAAVSFAIDLDTGDTPWPLLGNMVQLQDLELGINLMLLDGDEVSLTLAGTFTVGAPPDYGAFTARVSLPDLTISAALQSGSSLSLTTMLSQFTSGSAPSPDSGNSLTLSQLNFSAKPPVNVYSFSGEIDGVLSVGALRDGGTALAIKSLSWDFNHSTTGLAIDLRGVLTLLNANFVVSASRPARGDWTFSGMLAQPTTLTDITKALLPFELTPPDITLTALTFATTPATSTYAVSAALAWIFQLGDVEYELDAALQLSSSRTSAQAPAQYTGQIGASLTFSGLHLGVLYAFQPNSKTITFSYQSLKVIYTSSPTDPILSIQFGDTSLGDLAQFFFTIANRGRRTTLPSPWNVLDDIHFNNLSIDIHLKTKMVKVDYPITLNLGFMSITRITVVYQKQYGQAQLPIAIDGTFLGQPLSGDNALQWDMMNGSPPAAPGAGAAVFDLSYLAIGQRLGFTQTPGDSVADVIAAMRSALKPPQGASANPVAQSPGLQYDAAAGWLFGLQLQAIKAVSLSLVFVDPQVYGLHIALSGDNAKSLAGLSFEVLYRKIGPNLGQYHVDFQVPTAFRTLEMGAVSITLPVFIVDIYTNGNFKINLGYPPSLTDWSKSFAIEVFPFVGFGGFYFGVLNGQTSTNVPAITNGSFHPVLEFGLALSIGVGKTISLGPLSGGITVTVVGALQGTLAWFRPTDASLPETQFYRLDGAVGIVGKVWGSVDFVIVQASVSLTVSAFVSIEIEVDEPINISFEAGVSAEASVKVLFIRIYFSFSTTISESFTIGSASPTPWVVGQDARNPALGVAPHEHGMTAAARAYRLASTVAAHPITAPGPGPMGKRPLPGQSIYRPLQRPTGARAAGATLRALHPLANVGRRRPGTREFGLLSRPAPARRMKLSGLARFNVAAAAGLAAPVSTAQTVTLYAVPVISQAQAADLKLIAPPTKAPALALLLGIKTSADSAADTLPGLLRKGTGDQSATPSDFDVLARTFFADVLASIGATAGATSVLDLLDLKAELDDPDKIASEFSYQNIVTYLSDTNLNFNIVPPPQKLAEGAEIPAGFFPMIPTLTMAVNGVTVNFDQQAQVDAAYEAALDAWFGKLKPQGSNGGAGLQATARRFMLQDGTSESFAQFLFRMYFVMVLKQLVQAALDLLAKWPQPITTPASTSLNSLAQLFQAVTLIYDARQSDTLATVAALFGVPLGSLEAANPDLDPAAALAPGTQVAVPFQVTALSIAAANRSQPGILMAQSAVSLNDVIATVATGDTLGGNSGVAARFGIDPVTLATANQDEVGLLTTGATFTLTNLSAAIRVGSTLQDLLVYWAPPGTSGGNFAPLAALQLTAGQSLTLPQTYGLYLTVAGDTLATIAAAQGAADVSAFITTLMAQNPAILASPQLAGTNTSQTISFAELPVTVPTDGFTFPYVTAADDTLASIVAAFYPELSGDKTANAAIIAHVQTLNPGVADPPPPGTTLLVPYTTTLRHLAIYYGVSLSTLVSAIGTQGGLLAPRALLSVPAFNAAIQAGDTFTTLAQRYNLSLEELVDSIAGQTGYLAAATVAIPHVPAVGQDSLLNQLGINGNYTGAANAVSRYFLGGLRVPTPDNPDDGKTLPVFILSGQEIAAPTGTDTVTIGLSGAFPNLQFNGGGDPLSFALTTTEIDLIKSFASISFDATILWRLPLRPYVFVPPSYPLRTALLWQAATPPAGITVGSGVTGSPTLWALPAPVIRQAADGSNPPFEVVELTPKPTGGATAATVSSSFCSIIPIQIRRQPADGRNPPDGAYLMVGPDQQGTELLTAAIDHLSSGGDTASLFLLHAPNRATANGKGFVSDALDLQATLLLRINLSTVANPPPQGLELAVAANPPPLLAAGLGDAADFLQLLRDAGSARGGYYFSYRLSGESGGLPDVLFDASGAATLQLLVLMASQYPAAVQSVQPFNTHVAVWSNLDNAASHLALQPPARQVATGDTLASLAATLAPLVTSPAALAVANQSVLGVLNPGVQVSVGQSPTVTVTPADTIATIASKLGITPTDFGGGSLATMPDLLNPGAFVQGRTGLLVAHPTLDTGTVGFQLGRGAPDPTSAAAQSLLDGMFQLLGFTLQLGDGVDPVGVPVGPAYDDPDGSGRATAGPPKTWLYQSALNMIPFGTGAASPDIQGLPLPANDPYRAVGQSATVQQTFLDVLGNLPGSDPLVLLAPVQYTDPLTPLSRWPSVSSAYSFVNGPLLDVALDFSAGRYMAPVSTAAANAIASAGIDRDRFARIWYQLWQPDMTTTLSVSIATLTGPAGADPESDVRLGLRDLAGAAYVYLAAVAAAKPVSMTTAGGETLASLATTWSVDASWLISINGDADLSALFGAGATIQLPRFHSVLPGDTATTIVEAASIDLATLVSLNPEALLTAGLSISRPVATLTVSAGQSADDLAKALSTTIGDANGVAGLASSSQNVTLTPALTLTYQGNSVITNTTKLSTLALVAQQFQTLLQTKDKTATVTAADVATANPYLPGLFQAGTTVSAQSYVSPPATTLAEAAATLYPGDVQGPQKLVAANQMLAGLFSVGSALVVGAAAYAVAAGDSFAILQSRFAMTAAQLARANLAAPSFVRNQVLTIPAMMAPAAGMTAPYAVAAGDTLAAIAGKFADSTAVTILTSNQALPGLFAPGCKITSGVVTYKPSPTDTPTSVAQALALNLAGLAALIADAPGLLRPGATLFAPAAAAVPGDTLTTVTARWLAYQSGLSMGATGAMALLAAANANVGGLIAAGQTVTYPGVASITTGARDTFSTLAARLSAAMPGATILPGDVARRNPELALNAAPLLLPPGPTVITAAPSIVMTAAQAPVTVSLTFARQANVPADLAGTDVATALTTIQPSSSATGDQAMSLATFAANFEQALPGMKLAKGPGHVPAEPGCLWAINFGYGDGPQYAVKPDGDAVFFSLPPLATAAWSATEVTVPVYVPGTGIQGKQEQSFLNMWPDEWLSTLLSTMDTALALPAALQAWMTDPTDTQAILGAKQALSDKLSKRTAPIFATGGGDKDAASDAMEQLLLTQLGNAGTVEAIVQLPFSVTSSATVGGPTVSLYAVLTANLPDTGAAATPGDLASALGLNPDYLVEMIAGQPFLLRADTVIVKSDSSQTYTITSTDTLSTVAAAFGLSVDAIAKGTLSAQGGKRWFRPSTPINATLVVRRLSGGAGTTFTDLANSMGCDLATLFKANADATGLFAVNTALTLDGYPPITVATGDTPNSLAAQLKMPTPVLANFAEAISVADFMGAAAYTLGDGKLSLLSLLPAYTLGASRISLASGASYGNFALTVKEPQDTRQLFLDLEAAITALAISLPGGGDVELVDWLTLIRPLTLDIGATAIPVPLRQLPAAPKAIGQSNLSGSNELSNIPMWTYMAELGLQFAAQDQLSLTISLASSQSSSGLVRPGLTDSVNWEPVYQALAGFSLAAPKILADLACLRTATPSAATRGALSAVATFAGNVLAAWPNSTGIGMDVAVAAAPTFDFLATPQRSMAQLDEFDRLAFTQISGGGLFIFSVTSIGQSDINALNQGQIPDTMLQGFSLWGFPLGDNRKLSTKTPNQCWLLLDAGSNTASPAHYTLTLNTGNAQQIDVALTYLWPAVSLADSNGQRTARLASLHPKGIQLTADRFDQVEGDTVYYPLRIPVNSESRIQFQFAGLDIFAQQQGSSAFYITRNADLGKSGQTVNPQFVFTTPNISFSNPLTPLLVISDPIPIDNVHPTADLTTALTNQFNLLFARLAQADPTASRYIQAELRGQFLLGVGGMTTQYPLGLLTATKCAIGPNGSGTPLPTLASNLATIAATGWTNAGLPASGQVVMSLKVFADVGATLGQPLLLADQMVSST